MPVTAYLENLEKLAILIAVREMLESLLNPFLGPFKPLGACIYHRD